MIGSSSSSPLDVRSMTAAGRLPFEDPKPELDCLARLDDDEDSRRAWVTGVLRLLNERGAPI